jgi:hypothetical protein
MNGLRRRFTQRPVRLGGIGAARALSGSPTITGYAAVFYNPANPGSEFELAPGLFERLMPTAFNNALARQDDALGLFNHNADLVLGRVSSGALRLVADTVGLKYSIDPPDTSVGRDVSELLARQDVRGSSFAFIPTAERERRDGSKRVIEVHDLQLFDVGPVAYPAYAGTTAGVGGGGGRALYGRAADRDMIDLQLLVMEAEGWRPNPPPRPGSVEADIAAIEALLRR